MNRVFKMAARTLGIAAVGMLLCLGLNTQEASAASKYMLKINKQANVCTAYQKSGGKWKPVRAMLTTCGTGGENATPSGTFKMKYQRKWLHMVTESSNCYAQNTSQIYGPYFIHSVWYYRQSKNAQATGEFNKLGRNGSHGCVRVSVMDGKWINDHCKPGTTIQIYSSSKPGPLGKPKAIKSSSGWDPTDPSRNNPSFHMRPVKIKIKKASSITYGKAYKLTAGVKATNPNANQNVSNLIKVKSLTRNGKKIKLSSYKSSRPAVGKYKVRYYVRDPYTVKVGKKGVSKSFTFQVKDQTSISRSGSTQVETGSITAAAGLKARTRSGKDLTRSMQITLTGPGVNKTLSYSQAASYKLDKAGSYTITCKVTNPYPKKTTSKSFKITVTEPEPVPPETPEEDNPQEEE